MFLPSKVVVVVVAVKHVGDPTILHSQEAGADKATAK
jgi:hypothetical protein